jgi:hypothetical protein
MKKALLLVLLVGSAISNSQVTYERLLGAAREPQNWLTYSGRYSGWRYSTLNQINIANASRLTMQWAFQVADLGQFETTPLFVMECSTGLGRMTAPSPSTPAQDGLSGGINEICRRNFSLVVAWLIVALPF